MPRFVVRRHAELRHDLYLEIGDTFFLWVMDKGPSPSPKEERAAVESGPVEAPLDVYAEGPHLVWDVGTYVARVDPIEGLRRGKLLLDASGYKLKGTFSLARGKGRPQGRGRPWIPSKAWLLLKKPDAYGDPRGHYSPRSVLSGLRPGDDPVAVRAEIEAALPDTRFAGDATPMEPGPSRTPFSDPRWFFELDPGGERALIDRTDDRFVEIRAALAALPVDVLLDGQLVVLDAEGRPDPKGLLSRMSETTTAAEHPITLFARDLLACEQRDLRGLPLRARKELLRRILPERGPLMFADHIVARGDALAEEVKRRGGFAILARRADAPYTGGPSDDCVHVVIDAPSVAAPKTAAKPERGLANLKVRLSNLDKIFWPEAGYTKGDLLRYYRAVAPHLLPHLVDRPLVLTRFPDGIHGKSFFQHNAPGAKSKWLRTVRIQMSKRPRDYFLADDVESLLYLVNLGTIPLHAWPSRVRSIDQPDWCVIDLDAGERGFSAVVEVARRVHDLCRAIALPAYPKTSGSKGMHVLIPLGTQLTYEQSRALGELIARTIADSHPDLCTTELTIADRGGKVYLDHLVNARGRMIVAPYAARAVPAATVSTPLEWDEVGADLDPARFTIETVPARLAERGDPWADMAREKADIAGALQRLAERFG